MPPRWTKKASTPKAGRKEAAVIRIAQAESKKAELVSFIDQNDPLIDRAAPPIPLNSLFSMKLSHRTFSQPGMGELPYDWGTLRAALEKRSANSPRWYMQIREEDLLMDPDGLEGVVVDCFVIAEASEPTLSPAYYIVKQHWPYSDLEDNAPERILPIEGQGMCWQRVVHNDGRDMNAFLLQKRQVSGGIASSTSLSFGFGTAPMVPVAAATPAELPASGFGFGFGSSSGSAPPTQESGPVVFGFGALPQQPVNNAKQSFNFGFGTTSNPSPSNTTTGETSGFFSNTASQSTPVTQLKASEILFALWSKKRLAEMAKNLKAGSRIVREDFNAGPSAPKIKLIMQNDLKDDVTATVKNLILNKVFAKQCEEIKGVDEWIDNCPVYEEKLAEALQKFRAKHVQEVAEESDIFKELYAQFSQRMETELTRIVQQRKENVQKELNQIEEIQRLMREKKIAEKGTFRLLKYYAKNDVQRFRPFGKISGISEMGECADLCEPKPHVVVNPFTTMKMS